MLALPDITPGDIKVRHRLYPYTSTLVIILLMDMNFRGVKKNIPKPKINEQKNLPGFRASSELPEHVASESVPVTSVTETELAGAFTNESDPTDLTLDRDKKPGDDEADRPFAKPPKAKSKKKHIIILLILLGLVVASAGGWLVWQKLADKSDKDGEVTTSNSEVKTDEKPITAPSPITGIDTTPELASKPVIAVMIENSVVARPQSGLSLADMVVEAVAEGGITRFVALFQSGRPASIGPIRSARLYYVEMARTFDAAYVHAGGSDDGLAKIKELGVKDMNAFEENGTYERVDFRDAPHDLYSSMDKLISRSDQLGYKTSTYTSWKHKNDTAQTPTASRIDFKISGADFNAAFDYDIATNSYKRNVGGEPQLDLGAENSQISPKVVIGLVTSKGANGSYSTYRLTGTGDIRVYQDGIESIGTWSKDSPSSQFVFKDKNGLEFNFNKGQVWVTLLGSTSDISTTP